MSFLNAAMLFGMVAAAIPVLIHLFHRQRVSTVEFSSVSFIRNLNLHQSRALKLRQFLILLLRTLVILLVVLAFARPTLESDFWSFLGTGIHQKTAVVIILDDSYSMGSGSDTAAFNQAKASGMRMLNALQEGDEAAIVLSSTPVRAMPDQTVLGIERVRSALAETEVSEGAGDMASALNLASSILANSMIVNREIVVLTDMQIADWETLRESESVLPVNPDIEVTLLPVSPQIVNNVSLNEVTVRRSMVATNRPESITAAFTNWSDVEAKNRNVSIFIDGVKRGSKTLDSAPGQDGTIRFELTLNAPGRHTGYVEIDSDDLMVDNRRYFTLTVPDVLQVAVLAREESGYFLKQVLSPTGTIRTPIEVQTASSSLLNGDQISSTDVIVVDGDLRLSELQLTSLERFVAQGGGLVMFLGNGVDPAIYNNTVMSTIFNASIEGRTGSPGRKTSFISLSNIDFVHPIFDVFREQSGTIADSPRFYTAYSIKTGARVIASFSNGTPAVIEGRHGQGRAILIASTLNTQWSDLPLKSLFVPFVHQGVRYVHVDYAMGSESVLVGTPVERIIPWSNSDGPVTVTRPSDESERLIPLATDQGMRVIVPRADEAGIYSLEAGPRLIGTLAANVDTRES
ncbi:MAG: VWA domain-containing protein, partial [Candidatus Latescibacteria bacterium]|nr:VWA domain-containing protein [Candidatus Latescibacterota bacterium]